MSLKAEEALGLAMDYTKKTVDGMGAIKGDDGFSPIITENSDNTDGVYKLDITTADGSMTTPNLMPSDYLPLSGGTMNRGSEISIQGSTDSRKTMLTGSGVHFVPSSSTEGAYAFGLSYRTTDNTSSIGGIGAFGTGNNLQYYYMGSYDNPLLKVTSSGSLTMKRHMTSSNDTFLLRYYQQADETIVAIKLGNFQTFDNKATIDIIGRNLFNGNQAGGKYTLALSFNSNNAFTFPVGGVLYYYGDFIGKTGAIDNDATPISIQVVQTKENSAYCDVYILLNKPAKYPLFEIDVKYADGVTWEKDVQWITDSTDIPEVNGTTSYVVTTKNVAFTDSTVDKAIADKNGNDITETYAKINDAQTTPYDTGRVWFNGEPIMRQDFCVAIKKGSTTWNDGCINYADCINGNVSALDGILEWCAFGNYTDVPTSTDGTYDINPVDWVKLDIDADGRNINFDNSDSELFDCIIIAGHIEFVENGSGIPQSSITKIFE